MNKKESTDDIGSYRTIPIYVLFLKRLKSPLSLVISSLIIYLIQVFLYTILLAIGGFRCTQTVNTFGTYIQVLCFTVSTFAYFGSQIFDAIKNYTYFIKCGCRRYFFDDDRYFFRIESFPMIIFLPIAFVWGLAPLPDYIKAIMIELLILVFLALVGGVFSLLVTIIRYYKPNKIQTEDTSFKLFEIFKNQATFELFYEYAKKEFSIENVLYKVDSDKYKTLKSSTKRLKHAQQMVIKYIGGDLSPLEINADACTIEPIRQKVENKEAPIDLFRSLDAVVMRNLNDTYSRFLFSREYKRWKRLSRDTMEAISMKKLSGVQIQSDGKLMTLQ